MRALILVDIQNDFLPGGALAVPRGDEVVPIANALQPLFELVVATKDWHPADHGSFAANHPGREIGEVAELGGLQQILWPVHCVQGTRGAEFAPGLETASFAKIFHKGVDPSIDSYSAFFDNAHGRSTGLGEDLRERGVEEVFLLGLATDYCVKFSALDALGSGFRSFVIEDGCRAVNLRMGDGERALDEMAEAGAIRTSSAELLASFPPLDIAAMPEAAVVS